MTEVTVTRGGQITLTKDIREHLGIKEGDNLILNVLGDLAIISKKDPSVFDKHHFLPDTFPKVLDAMRSSASLHPRLKRLGILP